jgi:hypothetical protein
VVGIEAEVLAKAPTHYRIRRTERPHLAAAHEDDTVDTMVRVAAGTMGEEA